jgi:CBS domain-containing protein
VGDLMTPFAIQVRETTPVRRAANLMRGRNIGCLPVVDARKHVVGIVTTSDLLELIGRGTDRPAPMARRRILARRAPDRYPKPPR